MASSSANPVASASPHGRWDARDAENVATNRAACNQPRFGVGYTGKRTAQYASLPALQIAFAALHQRLLLLSRQRRRETGDRITVRSSFLYSYLLCVARE